MPDMLQVLQGLIQLRPQQSSQRTQLHAMLDRALVKLARTLVGTQEAHPWWVTAPRILRNRDFCSSPDEIIEVREC